MTTSNDDATQCNALTHVRAGHWKAAFLQALSEVPVVTHACQLADIVPSTAYRARDADGEFAEAWGKALEDGIDRAEAEAFRRAVSGYEEPVIHKGQVVPKMVVQRDEEGAVVLDPDTGIPRMVPLLDERGLIVPLTVRKYSDRLLEVLLKGRRKSIYSERIDQHISGGLGLEALVAAANERG